MTREEIIVALILIFSPFVFAYIFDKNPIDRFLHFLVCVLSPICFGVGLYLFFM